MDPRAGNDDSRLALYFGCLREAGHYLWHPGNRLHGMLHHPPEMVGGIPWPVAFMDTGLLENRRVPDRCTGDLVWVVGGRPSIWHAFAWWDRSIDSRPGSNSGFYVRGFGLGREEAAPALEYAKTVWPEVVSRQAHPLVLRMEDQPGGLDSWEGDARGKEDQG